MTIEILGTGCPDCSTLAANAKMAADKLGVPYELFKITNPRDITARGVMFTPALAIDGQVKTAGQVLSEEEVASLLCSALV